MARTIQPSGAELRRLIRTNAAAPAGYLTADSKHLAAHPQSAKTCDRMITAGQLFRARYKGSRIRYFDSAEAVAAFLAQPKPPRVRAPRKSRAGQAKHAKLPKPAKVVKVIKIIQRTQKLQMKVVQRKPYTPPAPRRDAEIVHTSQTRYSSRLMQPQRNQVVTLSFIHGGMGQMR